MSAPQAPDSDNIDPDTDWSFLARGDNALRLTAPPLPDTEQVLTGDEMRSLLKLAFQEIADGERIYLGTRLVWLAIALSCLTSQSLPVIFRALSRYMSHDKNPGAAFSIEDNRWRADITAIRPLPIAREPKASPKNTQCANGKYRRDLTTVRFGSITRVQQTFGERRLAHKQTLLRPEPTA